MTRPHRTPGDVRFLRIREVQDLVGLSKSEIYKLMQERRFPRQIKLSAKAVAWSSNAISRWQLEKELIG